MTVDPVATAVASPFEPAALLTVATPALEVLQVATAVRFCVVLFEYVPVAVNCCVDPVGREEARGVMAIETNVSIDTVNLVDPDILPDVAVIVTMPGATAVANPFEPAALLMAATDVVDETHVTDVVRFCVELSEYVPVAVNCWVVRSAMLGLAGVIARETSVADVTVSVVDPDVEPDVAVIVVEPAAIGVARPIEPAVLLIFATDVADEVQATDVVRFCVVLSENIPVATN